ncbi:MULTISPECIES: HEAT repeat domain-containing protein [unclassified Nodularia (in: cyanobacteria)]|uniref:HEAT repeat domain-containing protein n=1 Tax=unclassified Nodularia (in: cyanobacteria) TaxID=2656917 RepID=UPI001880A0B7|nr:MULTISPECIES: HEAT repeat domain-containing protein [unclassified Nodularia (in: cyanobacteria)]MBE9201205.1 HEAT repeat domain-containing protein [Nodularia sp. LEGE 06071]MCC2695195.1 HEAT repeat domain-containing protein [Nodularia sp. LEGE 04288]
MSIWNDYLQSLRNDYAQWWNAYTLTDVVGQQRVEQKQSPLMLNFMVERVLPTKEERSETQEKTERLDVLAGLRKYAQEHVLLVGRPGSGKSTALVRLLLEEAEKPLPQPLPETERGVNSPPSLAGKGVGGLGKIPVLVELRYYQTSVLDLIRDFLKRHRLLLDTATIEKLLFNGQFLLLVDGINELPSEKARQDLYKFRQDYQKTKPMIFTTRDLGVGGDLGITKKLEMQPLTPEQMQQFVRAYLPEQGEQMLQNLGDRLREFGETPLLLWMLCSLFQATGDIPPNLGLVFRQFTQQYVFSEQNVNKNQRFKGDVPDPHESRKFWQDLLQELAFVMATETEKEIQVAIKKEKAEKIIEKFLQRKGSPDAFRTARFWLDDLLKHHLIQIAANDQIEFHHQLIQEYYTAECLLKQLSKLDDGCLQREYLNYLKWTEPLKLMLELLDDGAQAVQVVNLALEIDLQLGAKLAGAVKSELQQQTVHLIARLEIPQLFKTQLLGLTKSKRAISHLNLLLEDEDSDVRWMTADALGKIKPEAAIPGLIQLLEDKDSYVRGRAADALGKIKSEAAIPGLIQLLEDEDSYVRRRAAEALAEIKSEAAIPALIQLLQDEDSYVRGRAAEVLGEMKSEAAIPELIQLLEDQEYHVISTVVKALIGMKSETVVSGLISLLKHEKPHVRSNAVKALVDIKSEAAIPGLIQLLQDEDSHVRMSAAYALGEMKSEVAIPGLIQLLQDEDYRVISTVVKALIGMKSETVISGLINLLKHEKPHVRSNAVKALVDIKSEATIPELIQLLEDQEYHVIYTVIKALIGMKSETVVSGLISLLKHEKPHARSNAVKALGEMKSEAAIPELIKLLKDEDSSVRRSAADALGEIKSEAAIPGLIQLLEDEDSSVRRSAVYALGNLKSEAAIPGLIKLLEHEDHEVNLNAANTLSAIRSESVTSEIFKLLQPRIDDVRTWSQRAGLRSLVADILGKIESEVGIITLMNFLKDQAYYVRRSAADALGEIQYNEAISGLIQLLKDEYCDVRYSAANALIKINLEEVIPWFIELLQDQWCFVRNLVANALIKAKSEQAIPGLIQIIQNGESDLRYDAAKALSEIKSDTAITNLINLLKDEKSHVRSTAAEVLGEIKSNAAIPGLIEIFDVCYEAADALCEIKSDAAVPGLINLLKHKEIHVRSTAAKVLGEIKSDAAIPGLIELIQNAESDVFHEGVKALGKIQPELALSQLIKIIKNEGFFIIDSKYILTSIITELEEIQKDCRYYSPINQAISEATPQRVKTSLMYILHLSDLHFGTPDQAKLWSNQLATDLQQELDIPHLDALIFSGDIANKSTPAEYEAAQQFFDELRQDFALQPEQIIIVPGNHDLNWSLAKQAYQLIDRDDYEGELKEGEYIEESASVIRVRDEEKYQQRFEYFSNFYQTIKNQPYPLDYDQQYTLDHFPNQNLLILGLNSAWQLDHHYKFRASININTFTNALTKIRRQQEYKDCIKIAVWHHPLDSAWDDRIKDQSFMEQLAVADGFRFFLHGHVHQAQQGVYKYDEKRKLHRICAGTFGAPTHELTTAEGWQYNLLKLENNTLTVRSRKRKTENGAWEADNGWRQGKGKGSLDSYTITWE